MCGARIECCGKAGFEFLSEFLVVWDFKFSAVADNK
jgi:hypothetical protein